MYKKVFCWVVFLLFLAGCSYPALAPASPDLDTATAILPDSPLLGTASPPATAPANSASAVSPTSPPTIPLEPVAALHGIHIHGVESMTAEILGQSNVKWTRLDDFNWDLIEPVKTDPPTYDWSAVDEEYLRIASDNGVEVVSLIQFAPEWAQKYPGYACGPIAADAIDDFANFARELVSRYSQPPFNVDYWEIGNEPDIDYTIVPPRSGFGCWGEAGDPYYGGGYYAEVLKAVYPQIKAVDPEAQVLVGGLLLDCDPVSPPETQAGSGEYKDCTPSKFLEGILNNGGGDSFDGVSFHAYDYYAASLGKYSNPNWHSSWDTTGPVVVSKSRYLKSVLNAFGYQDKFLINTESALLCGQDGREDFCQTDEFAITKAGYLSQSYAAARAEGLRANIWYSLKGWRGSGLVQSNLQPYLAFQAFGFSAGVLREAVYSGEITAYPGIKGYEFVQDGARTWLVWALDEESHSLQLQDQPSAIYDVLGNPLPVSQEINVTLVPLYIQWTP